MEEIKINCPVCKSNTLYSSENVFRPFCSQRCQDLDLGAWANEQFRVEVSEDDDDELIIN